MTKEKMRIVVAEIMKWQVDVSYNEWAHAIINPQGVRVAAWNLGQRTTEQALLDNVYILPNYPEDLSACAEFEKDAPDIYWLMLYDVCNRGGAIGCLDRDGTVCGWIRTSKATGSLRTEAFIRLHGRWVE